MEKKQARLCYHTTLKSPLNENNGVKTRSNQIVAPLWRYFCFQQHRWHLSFHFKGAWMELTCVNCCSFDSIKKGYCTTYNYWHLPDFTTTCFQLKKKTAPWNTATGSSTTQSLAACYSSVLNMTAGKGKFPKRHQVCLQQLKL